MKSPLISVLLAVALLFWGVATAWADVPAAAHAEIVAGGGAGDPDCREGAEGEAAPTGGQQHECCAAACSLTIATAPPVTWPGFGFSRQFPMVHDRAVSEEESPLHRPPRFHAR